MEIKMNMGFIKLHKSMLDWEWIREPNVVILFLHILLRANYKDKNHKGNLIKRGSFVTSRDELAHKTGLTVQQVRTALSHLKSTNEITIKTSRKGSIITVTNWDNYQDINQQDNQKVTSTKNNNKNINILKKENNNINIITKEKKQYGEYGHVFLTDEQMEKLIDKFGEKRTNEMIEKMDIYVEGTGKKYKNYYSTALNWFKKEKPVKRNLTMFDF